MSRPASVACHSSSASTYASASASASDSDSASASASAAASASTSYFAPVPNPVTPPYPVTRPPDHPSNRPPVHPPVIAASNLSGPLPPSDEPYFQRLTPVLCDLWPLEFSSRASPSRNFASLAPSFSLRLSPSKNHLPFASFLLASPIGLLSRPLHLSISLFEAPGSLVYP